MKRNLIFLIALLVGCSLIGQRPTTAQQAREVERLVAKRRKEIQEAKRRAAAKRAEKPVTKEPVKKPAPKPVKKPAPTKTELDPEVAKILQGTQALQLKKEMEQAITIFRAKKQSLETLQEYQSDLQKLEQLLPRDDEQEQELLRRYSSWLYKGVMDYTNKQAFEKGIYTQQMYDQYSQALKLFEKFARKTPQTQRALNYHRRIKKEAARALAAKQLEATLETVMSAFDDRGRYKGPGAFDPQVYQVFQDYLILYTRSGHARENLVLKYRNFLPTLKAAAEPAKPVIVGGVEFKGVAEPRPTIIQPKPSALLEEIRAGKKLQKVPPRTPSPKESLLEQVRQGVNLKKSEKPARKPAPPLMSLEGKALYDSMQDLLARRPEILKDDDTESIGSESSEWSDTE